MNRHGGLLAALLLPGGIGLLPVIYEPIGPMKMPYPRSGEFPRPPEPCSRAPRREGAGTARLKFLLPASGPSPSRPEQAQKVEVKLDSFFDGRALPAQPEPIPAEPKVEPKKSGAEKILPPPLEDGEKIYALPESELEKDIGLR